MSIVFVDREQIVPYADSKHLEMLYYDLMVSRAKYAEQFRQQVSCLRNFEPEHRQQLLFSLLYKHIVRDAIARKIANVICNHAE